MHQRAAGFHPLLSVDYVRRLERNGTLPAEWTPLGRLFPADAVARLAVERAQRRLERALRRQLEALTPA
jgi:hypothetical protein